MGHKTQLRRDQFIALIVAELDTAARGTGPFRETRWPDATESGHQAVELVGQDSEGSITVEHTIIESYPRQINAEKVMERVLTDGGIRLDTNHVLPQFRMFVNPEELLAIPKNERALVRPALAAWALQNLSSVPWPHSQNQTNYVSGSLRQRRLSVIMDRWSSDARFWGPLADVMPVHLLPPADLELT